MEIVNCTRCGRVFRPVGGRRMCPQCFKADHDEFASVREYLRKNPGADIAAVSEATGVPVKRIQEYLREGRLVLARTVEWLKCERCDTPLATGRLCEKCAEELQRGSGAAPSAERPADAGYPVPGGRGKCTGTSFRRRW